MFYKKKYKILKNSKGKILKLFKINKNSTKKEIYINTINANVIKGWNLHKKYTCNIFLIKGEIEFLICNELKKEKINKVRLSLNKNNNLIIQPNNWFSFRSVSKKKEAIFLNIIDGFHSTSELLKMPINKFKNPIIR